jgi:hypothetical protein
MELSGGSFRTDVHDVVAKNDHAVGLFASRAERDGQTYGNRKVLVIHIRNGKLTETWLMSEASTRLMSSSHSCASGVGGAPVRPATGRGPQH